MTRRMLPLVALAALVFGTSGPVAAQENSASKPAVILPGPCGTEFAFQRVMTPTEDNWFDDIAIRLGSPSSTQPYTQFIRDESIAGALGKGADRHYFIGTYEVTRRQFAAVTEGCDAAASESPELPMDAVNWFDAVGFMADYNVWLMKTALDALEAATGTGAFVRLPTEAEWEFAARGGMAVPDTETRRAKLFPMTPGIGLESYIHHLGERSCNNMLRPVGITRPNPLGLYDIVGNVAELVQEPFRLNTYERLHGHAGGFIARGGSCSTPREDLSTALREEVKVVDDYDRTLWRQELIGFRIALVGMAQPERLSTRLIETDFEARSAFVTSSSPDFRVAELEADLARLQGELKEKREIDLAAVIEERVAPFRAEIALREAIMQRGIRATIEAGAYMASAYYNDGRRLAALGALCGDVSNPTGTLVMTQQDTCTLIPDIEQKMRVVRSIYGDMIARLVDDAGAERTERQLPVVLQAAQRSRILDYFGQLFVCQVRLYEETKPGSLDLFFRQIVERDHSRCKR